LIILFSCRWGNFHIDDHLKLRITCGTTILYEW
jgi:hypothetical protein